MAKEIYRNAKQIKIRFCYWLFIGIIFLSSCNPAPKTEKDSILFFPSDIQQVFEANYEYFRPDTEDDYPVYFIKKFKDTTIKFFFPFDNKTFVKHMGFRFNKADSIRLMNSYKNYNPEFTDSAFTILLNRKIKSYDCFRIAGKDSLILVHCSDVSMPKE